MLHGAEQSKNTFRPLCIVTQSHFKRIPRLSYPLRPLIADAVSDAGPQNVHGCCRGTVQRPSHSEKPVSSISPRVSGCTADHGPPGTARKLSAMHTKHMITAARVPSSDLALYPPNRPTDLCVTGDRWEEPCSHELTRAL